MLINTSLTIAVFSLFGGFAWNATGLSEEGVRFSDFIITILIGGGFFNLMIAVSAWILTVCYSCGTWMGQRFAFLRSRQDAPRWIISVGMAIFLISAIVVISGLASHYFAMPLMLYATLVLISSVVIAVFFKGTARHSKNTIAHNTDEKINTLSS